MNHPTNNRWLKPSHAPAPANGRPARIWTGLVLCLASISLGAQQSPAQESALESGYTIPPGVTTPIVMKALPGAACQLHARGVSDAAHSLKIDANGDGYLKIHVIPQRPTVEGEYMQIDCASGDKTATYVLHVRVSDAPTPDMPAPQTVMPPPSGSKILPALTDEEAQSASREELVVRGYPPRPDAATSPNGYVKWLDAVSRPLTLLPSHGVDTKEGARHQTSGVEEGPASDTNTHWSGFVANQEYPYYIGIQASWNVPEVRAGAGTGTTTASGCWIGLDGYPDPPSSDVEQAGTEQDFISEPQNSYAHYYAWTELVPAQPGNVNVMTVSDGDPMTVWVWYGDADSAPDINGEYVWYYILDNKLGQVFITHTPLDTANYYVFATASSAEWIMERPLDLATNHLNLLSDYDKVFMTDANVLIENGTWVAAQTMANTQLTMYNEDWVGIDNNELSSAVFTGPTSITFSWHNFH